MWILVICSEQQEVVAPKNDSAEYIESIAEAQGSESSYVCVSGFLVPKSLALFFTANLVTFCNAHRNDLDCILCISASEAYAGIFWFYVSPPYKTECWSRSWKLAAYIAFLGFFLQWITSLVDRRGCGYFSIVFIRKYLVSRVIQS